MLSSFTLEKWRLREDTITDYKCIGLLKLKRHRELLV